MQPHTVWTAEEAALCAVFGVMPFISASGFSFSTKDCLKIMYFFHKDPEQSRGGPHNNSLIPLLTQLCALFGEGAEEGEGSRRKTLVTVTNLKQQALEKIVMCKLLIFIGHFGEYSCLSGNERECLCL